MSDSIVFHGKIVNDGILYNIGFILRIKNNPKFGSPIVGLDSSEFFVQCVRGDTLVLKTMASPYSYSVELLQKIPYNRIYMYGGSQIHVKNGILSRNTKQLVCQ